MNWQNWIAHDLLPKVVVQTIMKVQTGAFISLSIRPTAASQDDSYSQATVSNLSHLSTQLLFRIKKRCWKIQSRILFLPSSTDS